jgi:uncharacterized protein
MIEILRKYNFWQGPPTNIGFRREPYVKALSGYLNNSLVKVILGQRRVGKSYLIRMFIRHLITERKVPAENILYINKDIHALDPIHDDVALQEAIEEYRKQLKPNGTVYIFLDEVQEIDHWEKAVNSLSQDYTAHYELFITGSNAKLLSGEMATYLGGRYLTLAVFPFSYPEFLGINETRKSKSSFISYLESGGIPESYRLSGREMKANYYKSLMDSIVLRDIVFRHKVRDVVLLERLIHFLIDSVGSLFSINSVVGALTHAGYRTNGETVGAYLKFLQDACFIHESARYDIKGKKILSGERKYYLNDLGFKYFLSSSFDFGIGKYLENAVFMHLKREGYAVYTGRIKGREIDFIAEKNNIKKYVQVAYLLPDDGVVAREFGNLALIDDNFEKVVVSMDDVSFGNRDGIAHVKAWDFLGAGAVSRV